MRPDSNISVYLRSLRENKPVFSIHAAYWFALAAYTLFVLISSGGFLHSWALLWLVGLGGLMGAPLVPSFGPLIYLLITYSVPRYTPPYYLINNIALPETVAYFAIAALIIQRFTKGEKIELGGLSAWLMIGLWFFLALSAIAAVLTGSPWDPAGIAPMGRLNQTLIMFFLGMSVLSNRIGLIALAITLLLVVFVRVGAGLEFVRGDHDLAYMIAVLFPFLLALTIGYTRRVPARLALAASTVFLLTVLVFTRNRGALVGLAAGILVLWLRSSKKLVLAVCGIAIAVVAYQFLPWENLVRGLTTIGIDQSSEGRLNVWHAAFRMIASNPILGVGLGNFQEKSLQYGENPIMGALVAHNNFLHIAGEGGLFALAAYTGLITATFLAALRLCRSGIPWLRVGGRIVEASMVGYVIAGLFLSRHNFALAYLVMGLANGLSRLPQRQAPE